jgi:micrococcal nuclease
MFSVAQRVCTLLSVLLPQPAVAQAEVCGGKQEEVRIESGLDAASLKLTDGRFVRLATVIPPHPIDGDPQAVAHAKAVLAEITNGKDARIFFSPDAADRYGRLAASAVLIEGKLWLEAALLERGAARVYFPANEECAEALLRVERKARAARAGLWNESRFRIFDAEEVDALLASPGRFTLVEGTIRRVGEARGRIYLDFGRRFTEDFTIIVPDSLRKNLLAAGLDPKNWRGRRIRVRGILFSWGGPAIEINLAQAIEFLDSPKSE